MVSDTHFEAPFGPSPASSDHAVSPVELIKRAVHKRLWVGIVVFILAAPAAVGLTWLKYKPYYQAQAVIRLIPTRPRILYNTRDEQPGRRYDTFFNTQIATLKSVPVLGECLNDRAILSMPLLIGAEDKFRTFRDALKVERLRGTEFLLVSLRQKDTPRELDYAVNTVVENYLAYFESRDKRKWNRTSRLLSDEHDKLKQNLKNKAETVASKREEIASDPHTAPGMFARDPVSATQEAIIDASTLQSSLKAKLAWLQESLETGDVHVPSLLVEESLDRDFEIQRLTAMEAQFRQALVTADAEAASPPTFVVQGRVNSDPEFRLLKQEIARKRLELLVASQQFQQGHPRLKRIESVLEVGRKVLAEMKKSLQTEIVEDVKRNAQQRAQELRAQLQSIEKQTKERRESQRTTVEKRLKEDAKAEISRQIKGIENDIESAKTRESAFAELLTKQLEDRTQYDLKNAELKSLEEERGRVQRALVGVKQRIHELEVESGAPGYVSLATKAIEPKSPEPYKNRRVKYAVVGVVGALGLAVLAMILLERRDDRIWSAEDLDISGKVELLGSLPDGGRQARATEHAALVCRSDPDSFFAEQVRNLTTGVLYPTDGKPVRTILITSAAPDDGKTTLAVNLATCIANLGKRVLLIDANFRKPDVAGIFKLGNIPGLGDVLAYGADLDEIVHPIDGLSVLTAGTPPPPGMHLLGSSAMKSLLEQSGERHDYVIVDAPPLMLADARMLAPMVDGVVCSFRALASRRAAVEESLATLRRLGARTIGVALMGVNPKLNGFKGSAKVLSAYTRLKGPDGPPET